MIEEDSLQDTWSLSPLRTPFASSCTQWKTRLDQKRIAWTSRELVHLPEWSVKVITWASYAFFNSISSESIRIWISSESIFLLKGALRCCHCGLGMWMFLILPTRHQHFLHSLEEDANSTASFLSPNQVHFLGQMAKTNLPATFYLFGTFSETWGSSPQSAWPGFNSWGKNWIVSSMTCDFERLGLALLATPCKQRNQMKLEGHIQDRVDQTVHHHPQTCIVAMALV